MRAYTHSACSVDVWGWERNGNTEKPGGATPVVENDDTKRIPGIVTDRDVVTRSVALGKDPMQMRTSGVMTENVITVSEDTSLEEAEQLMEENQVRRLAVTDEDACVGIMAQADLARKGPESQTARMVKSVSQPSKRASQPSPG